MSGLEVSAMICWTINRDNDGPMKAYKNLGSDLTAEVPKTANQLLTSMASAIVRSRIANSTIDEILQKRAELREAIRSEMAEVTKGWGVWLETIEITDVKILSGSLFKNMQCKFREDNKKSAEILKIEVDNSLALEQAKHGLA
jgi:regulator of protease activity HflC (stomatin/prohibitin superfamily)